MKRLRLVLFILSSITIFGGAIIVISIAKGYQIDFVKKTIKPTGLLVATSIPDGAQIWIDNKLVSATDTTINLNPGDYWVEIKRDGFSSWKKHLRIEKELVTKVEAVLFANFPDLKALTYTGAANPVLSMDKQKVIYAVGSPDINNGLWVLELADLPLGIARAPRQILKNSNKTIDFTKTPLEWSPDSKQVIVTFGKQRFLLDTDRTISDQQLVDISTDTFLIRKRWETLSTTIKQAEISKLPKQLLDTISDKVVDLQFSPDEKRILYTATASGQIPEGILPPLPITSLVGENRKIEPGKAYVYDIKEDKNYLAMDMSKCKGSRNLSLSAKDDAQKCLLNWYSTSQHLFLVQKANISIMESDGSNSIQIYKGPFQNSFAFPFPAGNRILVLASIGANTSPNLYAVSLR